MDSNTKRLKILLCYDFVNIITNEKENVLLVAKLDLFAIGTITLPKLKVLAITSIDGKTSTNPKISIDAKFGTNVEIDMDPIINTKINIEMKIDTDEPIFDFSHTPRDISINTTLIQIKM